MLQRGYRIPWALLLGVCGVCSIERRALAAPPEYSATVLPQVDPTDDPGILNHTSGYAINGSRRVVGDLGNRQGFMWSPEEGANLLDRALDAARWSGLGINDVGAVVGLTCATEEGPCDAFRYDDDGILMVLDTLERRPV